MHIKTIKYERSFKLERILKDEAYKYETLTLGCEVEITETDSAESRKAGLADVRLTDEAFKLARDAVKEQVKIAIQQVLEQKKKQEGAK